MSITLRDFIHEPEARGVVTDALATTLHEELPNESGGKDLILRHSVCGLATATLHWYFATKGINGALYPQTTPLITDSRLSPIPIRHNLLIEGREPLANPLHPDRYIIDPTYSQFFRWVGVTAYGASSRPELHDYVYPEHKIAVFPAKRLPEFATTIATHAHWLANWPDAPRESRTSTCIDTGVLAECSLEELQKAYADLWNALKFRPVDYKPNTQTFIRTRRFARRMEELTNAA